MSVWFITGASRGFGIEITRQAVGRGDQVAATARNPEAITEAVPDAGDALVALPLDVTSAGQAAAAVSATVARFGRIDALVNDAGRGLLGAVEEVSDAEARAVFDVNVFGLITVTRAVLPVMREQGAGTIINISSSGGFVGRAGWGSTARRSSRSRALARAWGTNSHRSESRSRRSSPAPSARTSSTTAASSRLRR
jgi:NAD(P)-dependent dehydrogenase (short-subunit alcohol dehydrogenase family)